MHVLCLDIDGELALEDVEPLALVGMYVPGRAVARTGDNLDYAELPGSLGFPILIVSSMPRSQNASPSSLPSEYPSFARSVATSDTKFSSL